jgi:hypothetical protein
MANIRVQNGYSLEQRGKYTENKKIYSKNEIRKDHKQNIEYITAIRSCK